MSKSDFKKIQDGRKLLIFFFRFGFCELKNLSRESFKKNITVTLDLDRKYCIFLYRINNKSNMAKNIVFFI